MYKYSTRLRQSALSLLTTLLLCSCAVQHDSLTKHSFSVAPGPQGRSVFTRRTPEVPGDASPENNGATAPCIFGEAITNNKIYYIMIRTQLNYTWKAEYGTTITAPSKTVPGEAYTIPELMEKAHAGLPLQTIINIKEDDFDETADFETYVPEPDHDLVDVFEMNETSTEIISDAKQKIKDNNKKRKEAENAHSADVGEAKKKKATPDEQEK